MRILFESRAPFPLKQPVAEQAASRADWLTGLILKVARASNPRRAAKY